MMCCYAYQKTAPSGYAMTCVKNAAGRWHGSFAHIVAYVRAYGPVPQGMTVEHLCHTAARDSCPSGPACLHRRCINPAHLGLLTPGQNALAGNSIWALNARKTHCKRGHPFDEANTYITYRGRRDCRACSAWHHKRQYAQGS